MQATKHLVGGNRLAEAGSGYALQVLRLLRHLSSDRLQTRTCNAAAKIDDGSETHRLRYQANRRYAERSL